MNELSIEDCGLLIPPEYLSGLPRRVRVRRIKGGIIIESEDQSKTRKKLESMVDQLRQAGVDDPPDPSEIARLVDEVRGERARYR